MAEKPTMRGALSLIKEKIALGREYFELFGRPSKTISAASHSYEGYCSETGTGFSHLLQFRLQIGCLYHIYQELGMLTDELREKFLRFNLKATDEEESYEGDGETILEYAYHFCYVASPFWKMDVVDSWQLFDKDAYSRAMDEYAERSDDVEREEVDEMLWNLCFDAIDEVVGAFRLLGCDKETLGKIEDAEELKRALEPDIYCSYEVEAKFLCVYSVLLEQFSRFYDALSVAEKRKFRSRKLAKEFFSFAESAPQHSCPSDLFCEFPFAITGGTFFGAVGDQNGQVGSALTPLAVNYRAGIFANIVDLYLFALDEEYHFLSDEYKGRSAEIFPNFVSKGKGGKKTA